MYERSLQRRAKFGLIVANDQPQLVQSPQFAMVAPLRPRPDLNFAAVPGRYGDRSLDGACERDPSPRIRHHFSEPTRC
jgi:hypothetical protein